MAMVLLNFSGHSQTYKLPNGYTAIPDVKLKKALILISDYEVYQKKVDNLLIKFKKDADLSDSLISGKNFVITKLTEQVSLSKDIIESKDRQLIVRDELVKATNLELANSIKKGKSDARRKGRRGFVQGTVFGAVALIAAKLLIFK